MTWVPIQNFLNWRNNVRTENEIKAALKKLAVYENRAYEKYSEAFDVEDNLTMAVKLDRLIQIAMKVHALNWVLGNLDFLEEGTNI